MEQNTKKIIQQIAEIQIEALQKLKTKKIEEFSEADLCKLLAVQPEDIQTAIDTHLDIYKNMIQSPELIKLLTEYQTCLCSYILWKMEETWVLDNQEGVLGAWAILTAAQRKFHPEYQIIL